MKDLLRKLLRIQTLKIILFQPDGFPDGELERFFSEMRDKSVVLVANYDIKQPIIIIDTGIVVRPPREIPPQR